MRPAAPASMRPAAPALPESIGPSPLPTSANSAIGQESVDAVVLLGPLYRLPEAADRAKALAEVGEPIGSCRKTASMPPAVAVSTGATPLARPSLHRAAPGSEARRRTPTPNATTRMLDGEQGGDPRPVGRTRRIQRAHVVADVAVAGRRHRPDQHHGGAPDGSRKPSPEQARRCLVHWSYSHGVTVTVHRGGIEQWYGHSPALPTSRDGHGRRSGASGCQRFCARSHPADL